VTTESLPRRDLARPVLRLAFTLAWTIGVLLVMTIVVTVASAASPADDQPARAGRAITVRQASMGSCLTLGSRGVAVRARRLR